MYMHWNSGLTDTIIYIFVSGSNFRIPYPLVGFGLKTYKNIILNLFYYCDNGGVHEPFSNKIKIKDG